MQVFVFLCTVKTMILTELDVCVITLFFLIEDQVGQCVNKCECVCARDRVGEVWLGFAAKNFWVGVKTISQC